MIIAQMLIGDVLMTVESVETVHGQLYKVTAYGTEGEDASDTMSNVIARMISSDLTGMVHAVANFSASEYGGSVELVSNDYKR